MRRSVIYIVLGCYVAVFTNTSMHMYSIEAGKLYTESYNISHVLSFSSVACDNPIAPQRDSMSRNQDHSHFHITKINSQTFSYNNGVNVSANNQPIAFLPHFRSNLHVSPRALSSELFTKLKILPPGCTYLSHSPVLLI